MPDHSIHDAGSPSKIYPLVILPRRFQWYLRRPGLVTIKLSRLRFDRDYWRRCVDDPRGSERGKAVARARLARCERQIAALIALRAWMHATKHS